MVRRMLCHVCIALLVHASAHNLACADTHYVSLSGNHVTPFTNWGDAATNIQSAIDVAVGDDTVLVSNGTYRLQAEVIIGTNITLESVSGREATIVDGCHTTRCFRLLPDAGCLVRGFTITNGSVATNECGGGMWMGAGNTLAECTIVGCEGGSGGGLFCGSSTNVAGVVSNLAAQLDDLLISLADLDVVAHNITNLLADLATGPGRLPPPDMSGSPGRPAMLRVSYNLSSSKGTIRDCNVEDNTALYGGGLCSLEIPHLVVSNCFIGQNDAQYGAGLLAQNGGFIAESTFTENEATSLGGGMLVLGAGAVVNCHVVSNSAATAAGGACIGLPESVIVLNGNVVRGVSAGELGLPQVQGSEFVGNRADMFAGGLMLGDGEAVSNTFFQNTAQWGGGVANWGGDLSHSVLIENSATIGGGILVFLGGTTECLALYNSADAMGGGVAAFPVPSGASAPTEDSEIHNNFAAAGGGIALVGSALARRCSVASNTASIAGGGVFAMLGGEIQTSLLRHNAAADGAGIYCLSGGHVVNSTVTDNDALNSGGGLCSVTNEFGFGWNYDTETVVANSILYWNTASNAPNFLNLASNVVYSYTCTFPTILGTGNITNSPLFADAAARDYHLQPSSPCIDAGNNGLMPSGTDLDGLPRPLDGDNDGTATVDMGCYEHLNNAADSDGDSMPDGWEFDHGLNLVADDSGQDADDDTLNNGGEYAADTDPQDGDSVLSILDISPEMGGIRLDWKGGREAWQILECRENLASTTEQWTAIFALPPPTALTNAVIDMGATNAVLFYRIRAER